MRKSVLALACLVVFGSPSFAQQCLHASGESPDQANRRREALSAARLVNTLQANQPGAPQRQYVKHEDLGAAAPGLPAQFKLAPGEHIVPGWTLTLDLTPKGYWFSIEDTTDPCGFRYISNQHGLIFTAEPLR
jgi:hypothetical protein